VDTRRRLLGVVNVQLDTDELEAEHIRRVLAASPTLGIDPSTLYRKRKRYGL
jgi:transcriptional regulator of acetoin/glycerol metabolism